MKVSVIIAARNAAGTITNALKSAISQTMAPAEIIVINDASTDATAEIVRDFGTDVRLITVSCSNAAAARNIGIQAAQNDWIAFLDADDQWYPSHLENAAVALRSGEDIAFLAAADYVFASGERLAKDPCPCIFDIVTNQDHQTFIRWFYSYSWFCNCTVVLKKSRAQSVGGFDESLVRRHDLDLFLRIIHGQTWAYSPVRAARIQLGTPGSISQSKSSCELFFLKSFIKLLPMYDSQVYREILARRSAVALNSAFLTGTLSEIQEAWEIGCHHISPFKQLFYKLGQRMPTIGRLAIRSRR